MGLWEKEEGLQGEDGRRGDKICVIYIVMTGIWKIAKDE